MARNRLESILGSKSLVDIPQSSGVYRFFDSGGELIYVGKAKDLRRRLSQYKNAKRCKKHKRMRGILKEAVRLEWDVLPNHLAACLKEIQWIQERRPRWNIAGAFTFRYPFVGIGQEGKLSLFCFTASAQTIPSFELCGVYRSRFLSSEAFFSWMKLLSFLGHSERKRWRKDHPTAKGTYQYAFRRLPEGLLAPRWRDFLLGRDNQILSDLSLRLLEHSSARAKAEEVEEGLKNLRRFWEREALPLRRAIETTGFSEYPVSQAERDLLFLRYRLERK